MSDKLIPVGATELQMSICIENSAGETPHIGHFGLFGSDSTPLCLGYVTADMEWIPDQMKTGYAQAMWQVRMEAERRMHQHDRQGVPEGAIEVTPEMSKRILEMLRDDNTSTDRSLPDSGIGQYL